MKYLRQICMVTVFREPFYFRSVIFTNYKIINEKKRNMLNVSSNLTIDNFSSFAVVYPFWILHPGTFDVVLYYVNMYFMYTQSLQLLILSVYVHIQIYICMNNFPFFSFDVFDLLFNIQLLLRRKLQIKHSSSTSSSFSKTSTIK